MSSMFEDKLNQLIERINQLESKVRQLSTPSVSHNRYEGTEIEPSDKLKSRQKLLEAIQSKYPGLMVTIAKRQDGGGLLLVNKKDGRTFKVKCYYSKNHREERIFGWFSLRTTDLVENPHDFYAMGLYFNEKHHVFIFSHKQVMDLFKERNPLKDIRKSNDLIEHVYIEEINNQFFETREVDKNLDEYRGLVEGGVNVSYAHDNLNILTEIIGDIQNASNQPFISTDIAVIKNKIYEVLKRPFLIPLERTDFFYKGYLQQFIEMNSIDMKLNPADFRLEAIHSMVLHIQASPDTPLSRIHESVTEINQLFKVPIKLGLSFHEQTDILTQLFIIGNKEVL